MELKADKADPSSLNDNAVFIGGYLSVILCLAVDELNPVKILCSYIRYFEGPVRICVGCITERSIGIATALCLLLLVLHTTERWIYYLLKVFFRCTFNNMFFRSIEIVGMDNLPTTGPVILTGNHNNQFVDGILLTANCDRHISFMIAQKSWDRPLIGALAKMFHCFPVTRPQDIVFKGKGTVSTNGTLALHGDGTKFMEQINIGDMLEVEGLGGKPSKVKSISSDTLLMLEAEAAAADGRKGYKVMPKVDQAAMYDKVFAGLRNGKCLGIFPEGGSHDRTDLLPLKAGVAIIALDAYNKHNITVPIVPVGLNYFKGHQFGGRVVMEFGPPIVVPEKIYVQHETDKRGATEQLLKLVTVGMRSCIVPTENWRTLQQIYTIRRLYVPDGLKLSAEQTMDLNRRFAVGIQRILDMRQAAETDESIESISKEGDARPRLSSEEQHMSPADRCAVDEFKAEIEDYISTLRRLGLQDHQVRQIGWWGVSDLIGRIFYAIIAIGVGFVPNLLFNLPVMYFASKWAAKEQTKALKASTVKLKALDVLMSYKVIYVLMLVPLMYFTYVIVFSLYFRLGALSISLMMVYLPLMSYVATKASEQGMRAYKDIVPLFKRLLPGPRREQDALPARRVALQKKLNNGIRKWGPLLGDLYKMKTVDWATEMGWYTTTLDLDSKGQASPKSIDGGSPEKAAGAKPTGKAS